MTDTEAVWNQLQVPGDLSYSARPHPTEQRLWLAVDNQDHRHLLISVGSGAPGRTLLRVRGLSAVVTTLAVAGSAATLWVDVHCEEPTFNGTFATVLDDLVEALEGSSDTLATVEEALLAWRWFWGRGRGLSDEAALGLFGELWFLDRWIEGAGPGVSMIMQVHDELVFEVAHARLDEATAQIQAGMCQVAKLAVPLVVDVGVGDNWDQAH